MSFRFRTFELVGICFCSACMQLFECVNIEKLFYIVADNVFRAMCLACVSAVILELNLGSDADSIWFREEAAAPTPI